MENTISTQEIATDIKGSIAIENVDFYYGETQALKNISLQMPARQITAFIGPSGCGKSTLLR